MRHVVIGTAGHVDHGKTALVFALTNVQTDRLPEEQRRGITIELGFAPWRISDELVISVIDAPGHRRLVHHMIAGATGIDLVLLVVAADEGVMPQTREHIAACKLLGVKRAIVAITKLDRVDAELAELAAEEALELLERHGIEAEAVPCSAKSGEGIDRVRDAVLGAIEQAGPSRDRSRRVRLSVDRVFTVKGSGTVVTGTLVEGQLDTGSSLRILGPERELPASARGLHVHGESRDRAVAPARLAINLGGVSRQQVERGDVITDDLDAVATRVIDVWLQALEPLRRGSEASLFIGTARSIAKVQPVQKTDVLEEGGLARLRLHTPLVTVGGDRFVLRGARIDGPTGAVLGGGVVLDASPPRSVRAAKRVALLDAIHTEDARAAMDALAKEQSPRALLAAALPSRFAIGASALKQAASELVEAGRLATAGEVGWLAADAIDALKRRAVALVSEHHKANPLDPGMKLQTLRGQLSSLAGQEATSEVLAVLTTGDKPSVVAEGDVARLPSFKGAAGDAATAKALATAEKAVAEVALSGVTQNALVGMLDGDVKLGRALLAKLVRDGKAIASGELWFDRPAVEALQKRVVAHLDGEGRLTIADFKTMTGLGRKQCIPLLEYFDREKVTKRDGGDRVKGS